MNYRTAVLSIFVGIAIVSFCIGQGKLAVKSQVSADVKFSDHDKIEKLLGEVAELQEKLATLTQKYDTHTHQIRDLNVVQLPSSIECDQTVVQWSPTGINREPVYKACRQQSEGNISVLVPGKESTVTEPPRR